MADLVSALYGIIGSPPPGRELRAAVAVTRPADAGAANAAVLGGAIGGALYASSAAGKRSRAVNDAHRELGLSTSMVWAVNSQHLFVFKASSVSAKPKALATRVPLDEVGFDGLGSGSLKGGVGRSALGVRLYGLGVTVYAKKADAEAFAATLQELLAGRARS